MRALGAERRQKMVTVSMSDTKQNPVIAGQSNDASFENVWQELKWRGLVHVSTDEAELERALSEESVTYNC